MKHISILGSGTALALLGLVMGQSCSSEDDTAQGISNLMRGRGGAAGATNAAGSGGSATTATGGSASGGGGAGGAPTSSAGAGGSAGSPPVTPAATGGSGGSAPADAGVGGTASGAGGAGGAAPAPLACPDTGVGPSNNGACTVTCTDPCGVQNLGTRVCTCTANAFACASCEFAVDHPLIRPPIEPLVDCALSDNLQENDETGCVDNERCQSIGRTPGATDGADRFCGCLDGGWDCDSKPDSFDP